MALPRKTYTEMKLEMKTSSGQIKKLNGEPQEQSGS